MEETGKTSSNRSLVAVIIVVVVMAIVYILSPIPCVYAANHFGNRNTHAVLRHFYSPFAWAYNHTPLRGAIDKYGNFVQHL